MGFSLINDIDTDAPLEELAEDYAKKHREQYPTSETSVLFRAMVRRFGVDSTTHAVNQVHLKTKSRIAKARGLGRTIRKGKSS